MHLTTATHPVSIQIHHGHPMQVFFLNEIFHCSDSPVETVQSFLSIKVRFIFFIPIP